MKICTMITSYFGNEFEKGLKEQINYIGWENILQIMPCYCGIEEYFYTIIYRGKESLED